MKFNGRAMWGYVMKHNFLFGFVSVCLAVAVGLLSVSTSSVAAEAADALVKRLSVDVLDAIKNDKAIRSGDLDRVIALVDTRIMPNFNFQRMTASAVGPAWRQASAEQKKQLQDEFKTLLVRTYSGALSQVKEHTVVIRPMRNTVEDKEVVVRTEIRGGAEPIQLDYRLERVDDSADSSWRIYNVSILGVWVVESYRNQFAPEINTKGIDGLIAILRERNKSNSKKV